MPRLRRPFAEFTHDEKWYPQEVYVSLGMSTPDARFLWGWLKAREGDPSIRPFVDALEEILNPNWVERDQ